jgi:polyferredoxin
MIDKKLKRIKYLNIVKYVLATAWVSAIIYFAVSAGGYKRINLLYNTESGISVDDATRLIMYYIIISVPLIPAFLMGKRAFCHYFCPFGVLNIAGVKIAQFLRLPSLHVRTNPDQCRQCRRCEQSCPKSLPVSQMVQNGAINHSECMQCGTCVDTCKFGTVQYAWKRNKVTQSNLEPQSQLSG